MSDLDSETSPVLNERGKRKRKNEENWEKKKKQKARNSKEAHSKPKIDCTHVDKSICNANVLTQEDIEGKCNAS